jgi:cold shock CspA family protein
MFVENSHGFAPVPDYGRGATWRLRWHAAPCSGSTVKRDTGSSSLQDGGKDVFVHISAVERAGLPGLNEGQSIEFEVISSRGKASAENLKVQR